MVARVQSHSRPLSRKKRQTIKDAIAYILVAISMVFILFPFLWSLTCSLRPNAELYSKVPQWLPRTWTLDNYVWAFQLRDFRVAFLNTIGIAIANGALAVAVAAIAAYSLARYVYPGKRGVLAAFLATQMLPGVVLLLSIFVIYRRLGLYDTQAGLVIGFASFSIPYSVLLLRGFFSTIPVDLEEQAMVDGSSRLGAFLRVTLPLAWPSLVAVFLFDFVSVWGDLTYSLILTTKPEHRIVGVQILLMSQDIRASVNWGGLIAAANASTLPGVILFIFLQRYLVEGITAGAIKG